MKESDCIYAYECGITERCKGCKDYASGNPKPKNKEDGMTIFDLDGTLTIVGDRLKYLNRKPKDWDAFYEACGEDKPNEPVIAVFKAIYDWCGHDVKIVTGRRESTRWKTIEWLEDNTGIAFESDSLIMRPDDDHRHDTILKPEMVADFIPQIEMVFEDRDSMVKAWRELGITCCQVAEGNF